MSTLDDRETSSRAVWEETADRLLLAVRPHATERRAQIHLPGPPSANGRWSDGLEGFARTFLLAAFRLAGARGADPLGLAEWYAEGLTAGVDPQGPERWPTFAERNQAKVEAASIAIALHETRPWIWDRLTDPARARLLAWLGEMVGDPMPGNNWIWFQAVTEAFSRAAGGPWRAEDLERTIALTDQWYTGDGWYSDGLTGGAHRNYDHYNGWAMHFYPLWFCRILGEAAPPGRLDHYRERLRRFLDDHARLVGANGSPLIQGRSLTYRFATLAPVWAGELFDATPYPPGLTRRLTGGALRHFLGHGAVDGEGLLTLGWHHPFPRIRQVYSGPASPYWASKGFAGLLLPADHPVWTAPDEPLPVERGDFARTLAAPGWLVSGTARDGVVRVVNHGSDHADPARFASDDPAYARLGYSTHTAPEMPADPSGGPLDSTVTLLDEEGFAAHRRPLTRISVRNGVGVSRSRAHWPADEEWDPFGGPETAYRLGPWITVASALRGAVEVRIARVDPAEPTDPDRPLTLRFGGWALPVTDAGSGWTRRDTVGARARVTGSNGLVSSLVALRGLGHPLVRRHADSNPLGPRSATPVLTSGGPVRLGEIYAAAAHLGDERLDLAALPALSLASEGGIATGPGTDIVTLDWPDGAHDVVRLPSVSRTPAGPTASSSVNPTESH
ncbi:DUF2264 domain-containing protein [Streptomyces profundus]|uniref:DUF2264 domain-containing protein n=1 Tax=Streptomyces profundus TaxID=2867410 RepID=UPI001D16AACB|nr:DUF2264 domain-containing protein [Streptomyces sp. MA3_2.13]UED84106.1 DUF2264 domain-containing protein [Streptomyces sp. MA3_2.13]